jgi:hypothetical protein
VEWGEFKLGDLFEIKHYGKQRSQEDLQKDGELKYNFVMQNENNNGVIEKVPEQIGNHFNLIPGNSISAFTHLNKVYYQEEPFYSKQGSNVYTLRSNFLNKQIAKFVISAINSVIGNLEYGKNTASRLVEYKIQLPIKNGQMDFDFMESFIAELEAERIAELEAYLLATGLKDYTLTAEERKALDDFENGIIEWAIFKIEDLFEKLNLKNHNMLFDKLQDTSPTKTDEFNLPLVNAKFGDNGIMFYGREKDFDSAEMTIDIISNGAIATGTVYAQPYKTGVLWDAYLLRPKVVDISKQKLLYLTASLEKSIKMKFGWDNKAVWSKVQYELISLPVQNQQPDYSSMENLISAIQKLVIKEVVFYADSKSRVHKCSAIHQSVSSHKGI